MRILRQPNTSSESGIALLWSTFAVFIIATASFFAYQLADTSRALAETERRTAVATALGEAATVHAVNAIEAALRLGADAPAGGQAVIGDTTVDYTITADGGVNLGIDPTTSLDAYFQYFRIEGQGEFEGARVRAKRLVRATIVHAFQFAVFMEEDLYLYNQADTYINGPVHCNGDIYLHTRSDLSFNTNYLRTPGDILFEIPFANWSDYSGSLTTPEVRRWVADTDTDVEEYFDLEYDSTFEGLDDNLDGDFDDWDEVLPFAPWAMEASKQPDSYLAAEGHTVHTQDHEGQYLALPTMDEFDLFVENDEGDYLLDTVTGEYVATAPGTGTHDKGPYHSLAGLSILSHADGTWSAFDGDGIDVTSALASAVDGSTIFDAYQAEEAGLDKELQSTQIDVQGIIDAGLFPGNGLLYVGGYGAGTGLDVKAFQFKNGGELLDDLTIVSPNSVYMQGDYNVTDAKFAAVMADSVHVLSNAWDDSKSAGDLPEASSTTYNMSIIAGDPT